MPLQRMFLLLFMLWSLACAPLLVARSTPPVLATAGGGGIVIPQRVAPESIPSDVPGGRYPTPFLPPTFTPIPKLIGGLSPWELKYRLLEKFPDFFFCDPDLYPVPQGEEMEHAHARLAEMQANAELWALILRHHGLEGVSVLSDEQLLAIYRDYKRLLAVSLIVEGSRYRFQMLTGVAEGRQGILVSGWIDAQGAIEIEKREPALLICPICLAAGTRIATPQGEKRVEDLRVGDVIWTVGTDGQRVAAPLQMVGRAVMPSDHRVVHLRLSDGREVWVSPSHPTADGRTVGDLSVGESYDGGVVVSAERIPYLQPFTYDILPSGSGLYWANGILLASSLTP